MCVTVLGLPLGAPHGRMGPVHSSLCNTIKQKIHLSLRTPVLMRIYRDAYTLFPKEGLQRGKIMAPSLWVYLRTRELESPGMEKDHGGGLAHAYHGGARQGGSVASGAASTGRAGEEGDGRC